MWLKTLTAIVQIAPPTSHDWKRTPFPSFDDPTLWVRVEDLPDDLRPFLDGLDTAEQIVRIDRPDGVGRLHDSVALTGAGWIAAWAIAGAWHALMEEATDAGPS